jgi:hypothetical protein
MWTFRVVLVIVVGVFLAYGGSVVWGAMPVVPKGTGGNKVEAPNKGQELNKAPGTAISVKKVTHFVKSMEGGILTTEGGQYSLAGVKVVDLTQERKAPSVEKRPKKTAEMTFVNNQLTEVVIRERK